MAADMKGFTAEEIAKSLRVCANPVPCEGCVAIDLPNANDCADFLKRAAADLIEEQVKRIGGLEELVEDRTKDVLYYAEQQRWIPVEERMPEDVGSYLVVVEARYDFEDKTETATDVATYDPYEAGGIDGCWGTYNDWDEGQQHLRVTHWKPMPDGPEVRHG